MLHKFPLLYVIKKLLQAVQREPIYIADADHDYIIGEIERCDNIEYKR